MYSVDELDKVVELLDAPRPNAGAPLPVVVGDEERVLLAYLVNIPDLKWDGTYATAVSPESAGLAVAIVQFRHALAHLFGPPNDEAFKGHPLAARGLEPYAVFEVKLSSWIRFYERMNRVHPFHRSETYLDGPRHFVFAFHDSTFECIANGFTTTTFKGSMREAAAKMVGLLSGR